MNEPQFEFPKMGVLYAFDPPRRALSHIVNGFNPQTFTNFEDPNPSPGDSDDTQRNFSTAYFYGALGQWEWLIDWWIHDNEPRKPITNPIADELHMFIGHADEDLTGPWRLFATEPDPRRPHIPSK